jgi:hypothetical protein
MPQLFRAANPLPTPQNFSTLLRLKRFNSLLSFEQRKQFAIFGVTTPFEIGDQSVMLIEELLFVPI